MRIALVGTKQAPRTTVARQLERAHQFKVVGMLDAVERVYRLFYYGERWGRVPWEKSIKIYDALYTIDPEIWIQYMEKRLQTTTRDVVIPDVRYVAELDRLRDLGFLVVRVKQIEENPTARPARALMDAGKGTVIINEYYGRIPVDLAITYESFQNMKIVVEHMMENLKQRSSE